MTEISIIKPVGDDDDCEEGERGERGKRGQRGHRGHRGHDGFDGATGPTGPTGPTGLTGPTGPVSPTAGALLKFSGVLNTSEVSTVSFLADWGTGTGTSGLISAAPSYPFAVQHDIRNLAVRVGTVVGAPGGTIVFDLLKNGSPTTLTVTYTVGDPIGNLPVAIGLVTFLQGDQIDLRATTSGITGQTDVSATVGVE